MPLMTQTPEKNGKTLQDHLSKTNESNDADYLAWKKQQIEKALKQSEDRSKMIPADKVWEILDLEH
ncbi:MAG: hypothetical protein ACRBBN_00015 [Methyloligellaceae bacterium]